MTTFPRVTVPGASPLPADLKAAIEDAELQARHIAKERHGLVEAMVRLGKRPARSTATKRKARKTTAHARNMRARAAAAYVLKGRTA